LEGGEILRIFNTCTNDLGESAEEMIARRRELVTAHEPSIVTEPLLDAITVEDSQGNRCFPNAPCTNESDRDKVFSQADNLFDQIITSKEPPWWLRRWFSRYATCKCQTADEPVFKIADLA
jgi:hypothetical protein